MVYLQRIIGISRGSDFTCRCIGVRIDGVSEVEEEVRLQFGDCFEGWERWFDRRVTVTVCVTALSKCDSRSRVRDRGSTERPQFDCG
jgi:hypothetical protein